MGISVSVYLSHHHLRPTSLGRPQPTNYLFVYKTVDTITVPPA